MIGLGTQRMSYQICVLSVVQKGIMNMEGVDIHVMENVGLVKTEFFIRGVLNLVEEI